MLNHIGTQEIRTQRLLLRRVKESDYKDMYKYMSRPEVARYVTWSTHENEDVTKALCKLWVSQYSDDRYNWAIAIDGRAVGNIEVISIYGTTAYIGYQISPDYWNKGMMTEALKAVIKYMFEKVGCEKCEADYLESNPASGRVMRKAGMKEIPFEDSETYKAKQIISLNGMKIIMNSITKQEWQCRNTL